MGWKRTEQQLHAAKRHHLRLHGGVVGRRGAHDVRGQGAEPPAAAAQLLQDRHQRPQRVQVVGHVDGTHQLQQAEQRALLRVLARAIHELSSRELRRTTTRQRRTPGTHDARSTP